MKSLKRFVNEYHMERLFWCFVVAMMCWTDVSDYHHMVYNKKICVWILICLFTLYKQKGFEQEKRKYTIWGMAVGCAISAFFIGTNYFSNYYYYNYTLGILGIVLIPHYILLVREFFWRKNRKYITITGFFLISMVLFTQFSPNSDKVGYTVLFFILFPHLWMKISDNERQDIYKGMIDGLCLGFVICQGYTFLFRPYCATINGALFKAFREYCTYAAISYVQFYIGYLLKYIQLSMEQRKWRKRGCFIIAAFCVSLLYLTGSRSGLISVVVITAVGIAWLYRRESMKKAVLKWSAKCVALGLVSLLLFPVAYAGTRYLPTIINHPDLQDSEGNRLYSFATVVLKQNYLYNGDWEYLTVKANEPRDSYKYITFAESLEECIGRMIPGLDKILFPLIKDNVYDSRVEKLVKGYEDGIYNLAHIRSMITRYANTYRRDIPEYCEKYFQSGHTGDTSPIWIGENERVELTAQKEKRMSPFGGIVKVYAGDLQEQADDTKSMRGDSIENGWFAAGESYSSGQLRNAIHRYAISKMNLFGHPRLSFEMYYITGSTVTIGHAHNAFLIMGYDYGVFSMAFMVFLFIAILVVEWRQSFIAGKEEELLAILLVLGVTSFGIFEDSFGYGNSITFMIFICALLCGEIKKNKKQKEVIKCDK